MKGSFLFFIVIIFSFGIQESYGQNLHWVNTMGSFTTDNALGLSMDDYGNSYIAGTFTGTLDFDPGPGVKNLSTEDDEFAIYMAKYDVNGKYVWAHMAKADVGSKASSILTDKNGNIYFGGTVNTLIDFDFLKKNGSYESGRYGIFLAMYDGECNYRWSTSISKGRLAKMFVDDNGNIYLTGYFSENTKFNNANDNGGITLLTSTANCFIAKYNPQGICLWAKQVGGTLDDYGQDIAVDSKGFVYVGGYFRGTADFDPGPAIYNLTSAGGTEPYFLKLTGDGDLVWAHSFVSTAVGSIYSLEVDNEDNVIVSGISHGVIDFDFSGNVKNISSGTFVAKYSGNAELKWVFNNHSNASCLSVDQLNNIYLSGTYGGTVDFDPGTDIASESSPSGQNNLYIVSYDSDGNFRFVNAGVGTSVVPKNIISDGYGNIYLAGFYNGSSDFDLGPGVVERSNAGLNDIFLGKYIAGKNLVYGNVFVDYNSNGIKDDQDKAVENAIISIVPGNLSFSSDKQGVYNAYPGSGDVLVKLTEFPSNYTVSQNEFNLIFDNLETIDTVNFALSPVSDITDLAISLINYSAARPGFSTKYKIIYTNNGTDTVSGVVSFHPDQRLSFLAATPSANNIDNNIVSWEFFDLMPMETRGIDIDLKLSPLPVWELGNFLKSEVFFSNIQGDVDPDNNKDTLYHRITGSYDPNDKTVTPTEIFTDQIQNGRDIFYTIRFQNTGTDTAFNIRVIDTVTSSLDLSHFELLASSHVCSFNLLKGNVLDFYFKDILLPDSTTNEVESHGFIKFKVRSLYALGHLDSIKNSAAIYFDFNDPIITNEAIVVFVDPVLAANHSPTSRDTILITSEETSYNFTASDFYFFDEDELDQLVKIKITKLPDVGTLYFKGTPVVSNLEILVEDINYIVYTPDENGNGEIYAKIKFKVSDGKHFSSENNAVISVTPIADTPIVEGATLTYGSQNSTGLIINRNVNDGNEVAYFKILFIPVNYGSLYYNDGITPINEGDYISAEEATKGLKFSSVAIGETYIKVQSSLTNSDTGLGGDEVTIDIIINKAPLTIVAENKERIYGDENPVLSYNYSGFVLNETEDVIEEIPLISTTADVNSDAGIYPIVVSGGASSNYIINYSFGELTIHKASLEATIQDQTRYYGSANPDPVISYTGFKNGDGVDDINVLPVPSYGATSLSDVGSYSIALVNGEDNNYIFTYVPGVLKISKAPLLVIAYNEFKNYGDENPQFFYSFVGFVNNENESVITGTPEIICSADIDSPVGYYDIIISIGSLNSENYYFEFQNGVLEVKEPNGVTHAAAKPYKVYPNPSDGFFTIETSWSAGTIAILNSLGGVVGCFTINSEENLYKVDLISSGVYFLKFENKSTIVFEKIIIR